YATPNQIDILEGRYKSAMARKDEAEAMVSQLLEGTRIEEIDAARGNYDLAQARVEEAEITLQRTRITAPVEGLVESVIFEEGERPSAGTIVLTIVRQKAPYARVHVPEPIRTRLAAGAQAQIRIDGYDLAFDGKLRWIAHDASYTPYFALTQHDRSHLSYLAEVDLIDTRGLVIPTGIPVQVHFPGVEEQ
ncbi:MAG: HlyD family efflux transporter periplasmic adaptor subunit, partial [Pseudomonadales bacterium]